MTEQRIRTLQKAAKEGLQRRKFPWRVDERRFVDGELGPITLKTVGFYLWQMGAPDRMVRAVHEGHISRHAFEYATHKRERPKSWKKRDLDRRPKCAKLRKAYKASLENRDGLATFDGVQVPAWMVPWLKKIRAAGWQGVVVSGYRTPEYSEGLCLAMCGAITCPGRCAGRSTNHACPPDGNCKGKPTFSGAIDVSDYYTFARIAQEIGAPFYNDLPIDPVHFSHNGH